MPICGWSLFKIQECSKWKPPSILRKLDLLLQGGLIPDAGGLSSRSVWPVLAQTCRCRIFLAFAKYSKSWIIVAYCGNALDFLWQRMAKARKVSQLWIFWASPIAKECKGSPAKHQVSNSSCLRPKMPIVRSNLWDSFPPAYLSVSIWFYLMYLPFPLHLMAFE